MSIVTNVVTLRFDAVKGTEHEGDGIEPTGNHIRERKEAHPAARKNEDVREDDPADAAGGSISPIIMVPVNQQREQAAAQNRPHIDCEEFPYAEEQFDVAAKQVEADHVEDQVHPVGVQ